VFLRLLLSFLVMICGNVFADMYCDAKQSLANYHATIPAAEFDAPAHDALSADTLFQHGQYPMLLQLYADTYTQTKELSALTFQLAVAIKKFGYLCPDTPIPNEQKFQSLLTMLSYLDEHFAHDAMSKWVEENAIEHDSARFDEMGLAIQAIMPAFSTSRVLLLSNSAGDFKALHSMAAQFEDLGIEVTFMSREAFPADLDSYMNDNLIDLVITNTDIAVSDFNQGRIQRFGVATDGPAWSMSFLTEISQMIELLLVEKSRFTVYTFAAESGLKALLLNYPQIKHVDFADYGAANAYFGKLLCKDKQCVSTLHNQVSVIIGSGQETVFVNTFLRIAQEASYGTFQDATVYITSKATWKGLSKVDVRDLANTMIYDSPRLGARAEVITRDYRTQALMRDIIRAYELNAAGVIFDIFAFYGLTGRYIYQDGRFERTLALFPTKQFNAKK
jgi:hypothetical protein